MCKLNLKYNKLDKSNKFIHKLSWGDSIATGAVAHMSRKEVEEYEQEKNRKLSNNEPEQLDIEITH